MDTVGLTIFLAALAGTFAFGIVSWMQKLKARRAVEDQGGEVPLSMRANLAIDVRNLQGAAIAPAIRSNVAAGVAVAFAPIAGWGSFIADPTTMSVVFASLATVLAAICLTRMFQISRPEKVAE